MKRPLFAWLLLIVLLEINGILLLQRWSDTKNQLVSLTNLVASAPGASWWSMAATQTGFILLVGLVCLRWEKYGVLTGTIAFLLALPFLSGIL